MIFVAGTMTMNPEIIDDFKAEVAAMVDKVRAEDGCLHYSLLVEDADKGLVNVLEKWRDDDALLVHFGQPTPSWHLPAINLLPKLKDLFGLAGF